MKPTRYSLISLCLCCCVHGQESISALTKDLPGYVVRPRDILATSTHSQDGTTVTVHEIKPLELADPTVTSSVSEVAAPVEPTQLQIASESAHGSLKLGVTIYRFLDESSPRSLVHYWPDGHQEPIVLLSSADFALIAAGIHSFEDSKGTTHDLMLAWSETTLASEKEWPAALQTEIEGQATMPEVPASPASFQVIGRAPSPELLIPIQSLHDLYQANHEKYRKLVLAQKEAAQTNQSPEAPKNIILHFWREEHPSATHEGGEQ